jgi:hypothetical protein
MSPRRFGSLAVPLALALAAGSGCARQEESILVTRALPITSPCVADVNAPDALQQGVLDLSFDTAYLASFEVFNNLAQKGQTSNATGVDTSELHLKEVDVSLDTPQDSTVIDRVKSSGAGLAEYTDPVATVSLLGQDSSAAFAEVHQPTVEALRNAVSAAHGTDVELLLTMDVTFRAVRASNVGVNNVGEIEARTFTLPISMCFGCLRDCSTCGGACDSDTAVGSGLCGNAQDGPTIPESCVGE